LLVEVWGAAGERKRERERERESERERERERERKREIKARNKGIAVFSSLGMLLALNKCWTH
jgi:hypothetical protein